MPYFQICHLQKAHSFLYSPPSYLIANHCLIEVLIGVDCLQRPNNSKQFVSWSKAKSQGLNRAKLLGSARYLNLHFFGSHRQTNDNKTFSLCPNLEPYSVKVTHWTDNFPGLLCQPQKKPKLSKGQLAPLGDEKSTLSQEVGALHRQGHILKVSWGPL